MKKTHTKELCCNESPGVGAVGDDVNEVPCKLKRYVECCVCHKRMGRLTYVHAVG